MQATTRCVVFVDIALEQGSVAPFVRYRGSALILWLDKTRTGWIARACLSLHHGGMGMRSILSRQTASRWLRFSAGVTVVTGLLCAGGTHPYTDDLWLMLFDVLQWPFDGTPAVFNSDARAINAVLGGTMVGWGMLMYLLAVEHRLQCIPELPQLLLYALSGWFVVDSFGSLIAGLPGNIILNCVFLVLFVPPLMALRQSAKADTERTAR